MLVPNDQPANRVYYLFIRLGWGSVGPLLVLQSSCIVEKFRLQSFPVQPESDRFQCRFFLGRGHDVC